MLIETRVKLLILKERYQVEVVLMSLENETDCFKTKQKIENSKGVGLGSGIYSRAAL